MESPFVKEDSRNNASSQATSSYLIKKSLLNKAGNRCARCYRKTVPVRLYRVNKKSKQPKESDFILLCSECIAERRQKGKEEKKRLWKNKASHKISKTGFFNRIRKKVLERDGLKCVWCSSKKNLGLGPLIPESRGGKVELNNYVCTCASCRPSKGDMLPLEYLWKDIDLDEFLHEQLDFALRVKDPGKNISVRFRLFAEVSSFLHQLTNDDKIPSHTRTRAELLNVKLLS